MNIKEISDKKLALIKENSPKILTGLGIAGMLTSTVLAVKATPKALKLIKDRKEELKVDKLEPVEIVKVTWKEYIPTVVTSLSSIACLIFASDINHRRNAALATAYSLSERAFSKYKDKVIETIGERKEKNIHDSIKQDEIKDKKIDSKQVIITSNGDTLCMDSMSGRYFKSNIETIKEVVNKLNRRITLDNYISLNELYSELGLDDIKNGDYLGWNISSGLIDPIFSTCLAENGQPCLVIDYTVEPKYGYDKML